MSAWEGCFGSHSSSKSGQISTLPISNEALGSRGAQQRGDLLLLFLEGLRHAHLSGRLDQYWFIYEPRAPAN
jgi:hypothetical protein